MEHLEFSRNVTLLSEGRAKTVAVAGLVYPIMAKFLIREVGFNKAVQYVSAVVCFTSFLSFWLATPNPAHTFRKPEKWLDLRVWIDKHAFQNAAFCWFMAAIAFMFFGFYAIFFEIEEVHHLLPFSRINKR